MKQRFYRDPVCGKKINRQKTKVLVKHKGFGYFLCCPLCQQEFELHPDKYAKSEFAYNLSERESEKGQKKKRIRKSREIEFVTRRVKALQN